MNQSAYIHANSPTTEAPKGSKNRGEVMRHSCTPTTTSQHLRKQNISSIQAAAADTSQHFKPRLAAVQGPCGAGARTIAGRAYARSRRLVTAAKPWCHHRRSYVLVQGLQHASHHHTQKEAREDSCKVRKSHWLLYSGGCVLNLTS